MESPAISLEIVQGPRKGETITFQYGSTIRIGRVVRGNNLAIKDAGISSKHLTIESGSGKWIIKDLGSSNGATLNSDKLVAETPVDLCDGDTLKLGETTSILIKIGSDESGAEEVAVVIESQRRNPSRRARALKSENDNLEKKENVRVTRSMKNKDSVICESVVPMVAENEELKVKRGRGRPPMRKQNQKEEKLEQKEANFMDKDGIIVIKDEVHEQEELNSSQNEEINVRKDENKVEDLVNAVKESCDERVEVDLEKMTLGEWFDFLEVHLPKQIIKETEEMMEAMRKKADRLKQYLVEQKKKEGSIEIAL